MAKGQASLPASSVVSRFLMGWSLEGYRLRDFGVCLFRAMLNNMLWVMDIIRFDYVADRILMLILLDDFHSDLLNGLPHNSESVGTCSNDVCIAVGHELAP